MIKAVLEGGFLKPLSPLPEKWREGQLLWLEIEPVVSQDELEAWSQAVDAAAAAIPEVDFVRLEIALAKADREVWADRRSGAVALDPGEEL